MQPEQGYKSKEPPHELIIKYVQQLVVDLTKQDAARMLCVEGCRTLLHLAVRSIEHISYGILVMAY